jgi:diguanylate cyclase (GGDEF)-like protein
MPPLRLLFPHPKSEAPSEGREARPHDPACSQTKAERARELSEWNPAPIGEVIHEKESTTPSFPEFIMKSLSNLPPFALIFVASTLVVLVGILNHLAGPQLAFTVFYLIPIVLVTWFAKRWMGFIFSILSALTWLIADLSSGATYFNSDIPYWNGVARLGSFFILTFILSELKTTLTQEKEYSRIDFLTGIRNRRYFIELVRMEINRARRYQRPFTLVCIDLDNFKTVNDCFGHSSGDILLRFVARTLQENIRATDTVARLGGDEFAILLPETGRNVAETILRKVQKIALDIMRNHGWPVTLSIGAVTFMSPPSTVDETLRISDQLMYNAKNNGKNSIRYEVFGAQDWPEVTKA